MKSCKYLIVNFQFLFFFFSLHLSLINAWLWLVISLVFFFFFSEFCSYWTNPEKISNVEHLEQMENSLRESLNQIRAHRVWL